LHFQPSTSGPRIHKALVSECNFNGFPHAAPFVEGSSHDRGFDRPPFFPSHPCDDGILPMQVPTRSLGCICLPDTFSLSLSPRRSSFMPAGRSFGEVFLSLSSRHKCFFFPPTSAEAILRSLLFGSYRTPSGWKFWLRDSSRDGIIFFRANRLLERDSESLSEVHQPLVMISPLFGRLSPSDFHRQLWLVRLAFPLEMSRAPLC